MKKLIPNGSNWKPMVALCFVLLLIVLVMESCLKDYNFDKMGDPVWTSGWAVPMISSKLSLDKILNKDNDIFMEDELTHQLSLVYKTSLLSQTAEQFMKIPDQNIHVVVDTLNIDTPSGDTSLYIITKYYQFDPGGESQRIDSLFVKSALITLNTNSYINHNATIKVKIPGAIKNGVVFTENFSHIYNNSLPIIGSKVLDFGGYTLVLDNRPGHINELAVTIELRVAGDNNPNLSPYTFILDANMSSVKFSRAFGYFGQFDFPFNDSITFNIFRNNIHGYFHMEDIRLNVTTTNSMGMPLSINFNKLEAKSKVNAPYKVEINDNPSFPNPIYIPGPDIYHIGQVADTTYTFGPGNSKIVDAINLSPQTILFDINGVSNPENDPTVKNYLYDTCKFTVDLKVEMPLFGSLSGFWLQDTLNYEMKDIDDIETIEFKVNTINHFPIDVEFQVYFADNNYNIIDSLIYADDKHVIYAAPVGGAPDYRVIENPAPPLYTFTPEVLTKERIDKLKNCKKMLIRPKLSTYEEGKVKIYSDYYLDVRISARFKLSLN